MEDKRIFRLAKPLRGGLLRLVFSRFFLIVLLLAAQIFLTVSFFVWLRHYVPYLTVVQSVFTLVMVIYLFNSEMDSAGKLTWMLLIAVLPLAGAALLLFTRTNTGHRVIRDRVEALIDETKTLLPQRADTGALARDGSGTDDLARYLSRSGCFPLYDHSAVRYFPGGETMLEAMLRELDKAESFIFLEYFILEEGYMWGAILERLVAKAKEGVEVRVLFDGMCMMTTLPFNYVKLLQAQGIKARAFSPIRPVISSHYNYRDHRKILVIDGRVAFTGGVNLADEYINRVERFGHWKDAAVMVEGDAVDSFTLLFLQMWNIYEKEPEWTPWVGAARPLAEAPGGWVLPYGDCPLDGERVGETVYMDVLNRATDYVHIMTPYLILDGELETALLFAAKRGVDVKLILPGIPDKKLAWALAKAHYKTLLAAGVKLYEYTPGFVHAKVVTSDDQKAVVGTINLDYRSLYHHFECAVYLYNTSCVADAERDFQDTLAQCRAVTEESIKNEKFFYRLAGTLLRFIAPLM